MEAHRPRKLKQGRAQNMEDTQWDKEYKLLCHRINYMEEVVRTGQDFPETEARNRDPPAVDPKFRMITVDQEHSKQAWGTVTFQPSGTRSTS